METNKIEEILCARYVWETVEKIAFRKCHSLIYLLFFRYLAPQVSFSVDISLAHLFEASR